MAQPARAVLVTGASRGIGAAVARAFAARGDRVAVHYGANAELAHEVAASLAGRRATSSSAPTSRTPRRCSAWSTRPRPGSAESTCSSTTPGVFSDHPIHATTYEEWQRGWSETLGVNLVGAANVTWCAVQHMLRGGRGGRIVNVASRGAFRGEPDAPAYGASKAGLIAFGQSLARSLGGHGIAVASVAPGFTETDMAAGELAGPRGDARRAESPFGRVATAEEVAAAVLFLASPEAEFTSGTVIDVNGASYLRM